MNQRENILKVLRHEKPEWTPTLPEASFLAGFWSANECGLRGQEARPGITLDCFGVEWDQMHGQPTPYPGNFVLEDIADWRDAVAFPDVDSWNWDEFAAIELNGFNREEQILVFFDEIRIFDRLSALMGFEEALISFVTDPEEVQAFAQAVADYKIEVIQCVKKAYNPDVFMYTDDIAKADGLFMHPDAYRKLIKPAHGRIIDAIHDAGMIAMQHTCGKCEDVIGDYVELGIDCIFPMQSLNDIVAFQREYKGQVTFCGGFDTQGPAGMSNADEKTTRAEARRCAQEYAVGGDFISLPMIGTALDKTPGEMVRIGWFIDEFHKECASLGV